MTRQYLADSFFAEELNGYVADVLRSELATSRDAYLTFNRINVRIDRERSTITIEDELDPAAEEELTIDDFEQRLPR